MFVVEAVRGGLKVLSHPVYIIPYIYHKTFGSPCINFEKKKHIVLIEVYSWSYFNKPRNERKCNLCNLEDIGDEYHYVMRCPIFDELRKLYIPKYFFVRPSVFKFVELMKMEDKHTLFKMARFFKDIMNVIQ